jgi:alkylated DNA repair dioxygenase AlkB
MQTLFEVENIYPQGFSYTPNFITVAEEDDLLAVVKKLELQNMMFKGYTASRKTASFGYDYSFDNGQLTKGKEIPTEFNWLLDKVAEKLSISSADFAELLVIEYPPGSVINWHRDAPPFDVIVGISLLSDCKFKLRPQEKTQQVRSNIISVEVQRRSLYVLSGEARTNWQHSTSPVKSTRYSVTLRTLRSRSMAP